MAFKAVSGVNKNVYSTYTSDQTSSEKVFAALEVTNRHFNHYKNRIVLKWQDIGPTEVLYISLYFRCHIAFINLPAKCPICSTCMTDRVSQAPAGCSWATRECVEAYVEAYVKASDLERLKIRLGKRLMGKKKAAIRASTFYLVCPSRFRAPLSPLALRRVLMPCLLLLSGRKLHIMIPY